MSLMPTIAGSFNTPASVLYKNPYMGVQGSGADTTGGLAPNGQPWATQSRATLQSANGQPYTFQNNNSTFKPATSQPIGNMQNAWSIGNQGPSAYAANPQLQDLFAKQQAENDRARAENEANWKLARDRLMQIDSQYANDPTANATRASVQALLANPEALNDATMAKIRGQTSAEISDKQNSQLRQALAMASSGGYGDLSTQLALQERGGRQGMAENQRAMTDLEVQRANQRNKDILGSISAGQSMTGQDFGINMDVAKTLIGNLPQYQPDDLSGWIASMSPQLQAQGYSGQGAVGYGAGYANSPNNMNLSFGSNKGATVAGEGPGYMTGTGGLMTFGQTPIYDQTGKIIGYKGQDQTTGQQMAGNNGVNAGLNTQVKPQQQQTNQSFNDWYNENFGLGW